MERTLKQRPRKATFDAHPPRGWNSIQFTDEHWKELEAAVGVSLNDNSRVCIKKITDSYIEETVLQHDGHDRKSLLGREGRKDGRQRDATALTKLITALRKPGAGMIKFETAWQEAMNIPGLEMMLSDLQTHRPRKKFKPETMEEMKVLADDLAWYIDHQKKGIIEISPSVDPFTRYICDLAKVVEQAGGRVSARHDADHDKISSFVLFLWQLNQLMPATAKKSFNSQWSLSIASSRALSY